MTGFLTHHEKAKLQSAQTAARGARRLSCIALCFAVLAPLMQSSAGQSSVGGSASDRTSAESGTTLTVLSSPALEAVLRKLTPQIERATGARLQLQFDTSRALRTAIAQGRAFDVAILTTEDVAALTASGRVLPGASVEIARSGIGLVVRAGAPHPDIGSVDAFKRSLLAAHSVAYTGASGMYFEQLLQRLGIAAAVEPKALRPSGAIAALVERGRAELGVLQISEIGGAPGVDYIGPLPESLQHYTVFTAGLSSALAGAPADSGGQPVASARARAARALLAYLASAEARAAMSAQGMQPM